MKLKILLTFDYELYFGKNHMCEYEVLIKPTKKLIDIARKHNIKLVFFIDICSLFAYERYNRNKYINNFIMQVKYMKEMGHDIQMHFHPHWMDSVYNESSHEWQHKYHNWSYSNMVDNLGVKKANNFFELAQAKFIDIVGKRPIAFRAGGYTIQPNEKELIDILKKYDYKYDSSVVPLRKFISSAQNFDYMKSPLANSWQIGQKCFLETGNNGIVEIPIFALKKNTFLTMKYAFLKFINKIFKKNILIKRGQGATLNEYISRSDSYSFSFDMALNQDKKNIKLLVDEYIKKYGCGDGDKVILNILSHPKALFDESLEVLEWFIVYMNKNYDCSFVGFEEL